MNKVCFCFPFPFLPLVGAGSGSGSSGGEDGYVEGPCPQAGWVGAVSPRMFLSDLFPEMNSFGGFFDVIVGNSGNADLDKRDGPAVLFGWGLVTDTGS